MLWVGFKGQDHIVGPTTINSHPFHSMSNGPRILGIWPFHNLTLKFQGQDHSPRSHSGFNILLIPIPFGPCQSTLPFWRCSFLKFWKSKVKVMGEVKVQSHKVGPTSYWLTSLSFHVNHSPHCRDTAFSKVDFEIQGQVQSGFNILLTHIPFVPW